MKFTTGCALLVLAFTAHAQETMQPIGEIPIRNYTSRRFHAYDANEDDTIDASELPPAPGETTNDRPITIAAWQDAYHARFDRFDTDADGCLSLDEVRAGRAALATGGN